MNPVIERELEKIRAPLPEFTDDTKVIRILKYNPEPTLSLEVGKMYLVGLPDYIVNEPPNYTLSANWNKGIVPKSSCLAVAVIQIFGKMVQVNARGYDYVTKLSLDDVYSGLWLPIESITVISEIA